MIEGQPLPLSPRQNPLGHNTLLSLTRTRPSGEFFENWHKPVLLTLTDPRVATKKEGYNLGRVV